MIPERLVIENFSCHERSEIDFSKFSSALIIGKVNGNDALSNGVGKTTIFKAIEYVLFNESEESLEKVIRDDATTCKVIIYFKVLNQLYRVSRSRNRKDVSDLSLHKRSEVDAEINDIYTDNIDKNSVIWKDISSRRTGDTEKDLEKLIKLNFKAFRNTVHFVQHDFTGIATLTAEKRKAILKDVLQIAVYSKLEKIAKDKLLELNKELDKYAAQIDIISDPDKEIAECDNETAINLYAINLKQNELSVMQSNINALNEEIADINYKMSSIDTQSAAASSKELVANRELIRINAAISDYTVKKNGLACSAKIIISDIKSSKDKCRQLSQIVEDNSILMLEHDLSVIKERLMELQLNLTKLNEEQSELTLPMPDELSCKHCRQPMTIEHKNVCQQQINNRLAIIKKIIIENKLEISTLQDKKSKLSISITQINNAKKEIDQVNNRLNLLQSDLSSKNQMYNEYKQMLDEQIGLLEKQNEVMRSIKEELKSFQTNELMAIKASLSSKKLLIESKNIEFAIINKELLNKQNLAAVLNHRIEKAKINKVKKDALIRKHKSLEERIQVYPGVIQAFSSAGIPHLIIQSVLDDWQIEANNLLGQLRPGLQLSFYVEKEDSNGNARDTLDIKYSLNNRDREYGQLSGAQRVSIAFALKLGLSFLLQKMFGADIKLLLLDEIDQSLDKAGVDAFADIVKFFQKDFTILVITHNDRLKHKFGSAILVEQNQNMISNAKLIYN